MKSAARLPEFSSKFAVWILPLNYSHVLRDDLIFAFSNVARSGCLSSSRLNISPQTGISRSP